MSIYSNIAEALDMTPLPDVMVEPEHTPLTDVSEYYAQQFREVNLGVPKSDEHRQKISESLKIKYEGGHSDEVKKKISQKLKGNANSKNHNSDDYRKKQSAVMKAAWERRKKRQVLP